MTPTRIGPRESVYENPYQRIDRVALEFDGFKKVLFVNEMGRRVELVISQRDSVLLVRQYRYLVNQLAWELPGEKVDEGETPEQAAVREALEETGLRCRTVQPLLYFHPGLDTHNNPSFLFSSEDFEEAPRENFHAQEVSERVWIPIARCVEMIFASEIVDSLTISALLAYHTRKHHPELTAS